MIAQVAWLSYAGAFYIAWTIGFRARYGRWPMAYRLRPRDFPHAMYMLNDAGLHVSLVAYTLWLAFGPPPKAAFDTVGLAAGAGLVVLGAALRLWTVVNLGPNWRMGQDEADEEATFVASGPYRYLKHPINAALVVVALGQAFLTGFDARAWFLLVTAAAYYLAQGHAERQFWLEREARSAL
jgi:protein-S-isoprenylcysteine O-methyltransferase Ste14